ncbi:MAG: pyrimidine-nucleoside phosphorylase, partial [Oscillochloris sp.]|nr:pyrimidine-nucleoside phosphorylase [Oscillochloris sp.]
IGALRGHGPADLVDLCLAIGAQLVLLADLRDSETDARSLLRGTLESGAAWAKLTQMIAHQGGDLAAIENPDLLPTAPYAIDLPTPQAGYVAQIDGQALGLACNALGGGRTRKEDAIDPRVGIVLRAKVGDYVAQGAPLLTIHAASQADAARVTPRLSAAYRLSPTPVTAPILIEEIITS